MEKGEQFSLIAEVGGKVVANSEITKRGGYSKHVGGWGIGIKKEFRDIGIGTEMSKKPLSQAEKMGLKIVLPNVFSANERAIHVYEKVGFKQTWQRPKFFFKNGKYTDDIIMAKEVQ